MAVKWLNQVMAAVVVLAWLPATLLCFIERAGWLDNDDCCASSTGAPKEQPAAHSTCCTLASASYKANDQEHGMPVATAESVSAFISVEQHLCLGQPSLTADSVSPPEFLVGWQFSFRAALSPRAPSLAS